MSKLFYLSGIKSPGRVNIKNKGDINLEDLTDQEAIELYKTGCPFLVPSPEGFKKLYPDKKPISVNNLQPVKKRSNRKTNK
jgi:hypothetical protein